MARRLLPALLLTAALAGCLAGDGDGGDEAEDAVHGTPGYLYNGTLEAPANALFAGNALYPDPQNAPHPAFNWPTLAYPAAGPLPNKWWAPANSTSVPASITGLELVASVGPEVPVGAGIAIFGSLVVVPGFGAPTSIVDISDPTSPVVLGQIEPQENLTSHRGAAFIPYPDGRLAVVISTGAGIDVWDLTDPRDPQPLPALFMEDMAGNNVGSHKVGVIPGTPIVVNAASDGGADSDPATSPGVTQMWDLTDPLDPVRLPDFRNGYSCHHVYFWNSVEQGKYRGVCAGIQYTQLWDTADPYNPTVVVSVPFGSGGTPAQDRGSVVFPASLSHYAGLSMDGTILLMGDESGGGGSPPGCTARVDVPGLGAVSIPIGAVWFYDVSDEQNPELLGWYSASQLDKYQDGEPPEVDPNDPGGGVATRSCTAHHGRLVPVEGRDVLAMSWYASGVIVVDFTDIRNEAGGVPTTLAQFADGSDTWETWYYNGYLYTGDLARGMDVLRMV